MDEIDSVSDYIQSTSSTNNPDGDSEDSTSDNSVKKRPRYACTFKNKSSMFMWAKKSTMMKGPSFVLCTMCNRDISVALSFLLQ